MSVPEPISRCPPVEILWSTTTRKTLFAMEAMLADRRVDGHRHIRPRGAVYAARRATSPSSCSTCRCPDLDGFETAQLVRARDRPAHADHLPDRVQPERPRLCAATGSAPSTSCSSRSCRRSCAARCTSSSSSQRKTQEVRRQARLIRESGGASMRACSRGAAAVGSWSLRAQMELERESAGELARKADELARAVTERDAAARALVQSNARLALLVGHGQSAVDRPSPAHAARRAVRPADPGHLDLDVYAYRTSSRTTNETLTLRAWGGLEPRAGQRASAVRASATGMMRHRRRDAHA